MENWSSKQFLRYFRNWGSDALYIRRNVESRKMIIVLPAGRFSSKYERRLFDFTFDTYIRHLRLVQVLPHQKINHQSNVSSHRTSLDFLWRCVTAGTVLKLVVLPAHVVCLLKSEKNAEWNEDRSTTMRSHHVLTSLYLSQRQCQDRYHCTKRRYFCIEGR